MSKGEDGDTVRVCDGRRRLSGVHRVFGFDAWPAFTGESTVIRRLRADEAGAFIEIDEPAGGLEIGLADLVIAREERERFEAAHGLNGVVAANTGRLAAYRSRPLARVMTGTASGSPSAPTFTTTAGPRPRPHWCAI